ncbi:eukaryotic translation initiation factor 4 gamma 3 [Folsomia candida]|uniref:Eukaryotic translation initiation factor 4 gamma 3 n=1 Tax=Folsomia candida TaxID=158441 RepID=A0A226D1R4_FOLCA|nr:eukaryotic translation initiation factor 4 gamma 3 [Folsomia candida]XP_021966252.1 eukaryotic translation initiation factor 4 gamma 3 [Folsomia candida]XP_021966253.1 eukaryotic translation initiation factor 4 gamma 3 [Folsomia candida]OXA39010.1 Eukaryotic translation initiation factor 4 gamma 3 [Folsomia candida]
MLIQGYNMTTTPPPGESPIKKYDRDLLIKIGNQPLSVFSVPESFLELAKEAGTTSPTRLLGQPLGTPKGLIPPLSRGNSRNGSSGSGLYGGSIRNSSNGNAFGGFGLFGPLVIPPPPPASREPKMVISLRPQGPEKLLQSDPNAWKPGRLKARSSSTTKKEDETPKTEEELIIEGIVKDTRGILNKLTPENFDRLMVKFIGIPLQDKEGRIAAVINVLFEKAIDEPAFSAAYAKMVTAVCSSSVETSRVFRKQIIDKCQHEFQRSDTEEDTAANLLKKIQESESSEEKESLKFELEELKSSMRKRALGNVRFIGELYKLQMLSPKIMVSCVALLLSNPDDEKLESLCKLLTTIGQKLDEQLKELEVKTKKEGKPGPEEKWMDKVFVSLSKLSEDKKISSRIRFAIMDLVELRSDNGWRPRRQVGGPKTIEEVHRDAYMQELEEKRQIDSLPPLEGGGGRGGRDSHTNSPMSHVPKKADWTTVQNKAARFTPKKPADRSGPQSFTPMFGTR